ncbi:hypothetical protein L3Q82_013372, partial [Scortum barcoo]
WDDVVVVKEGMPTTLFCIDATVRGATAINWMVKPLGAKEWKLALSANEKNEFSGGAWKASMRLTDPNFQDTGVFSLFLQPNIEDSGHYSCRIKQQERELKERNILLAILTVTVVPAQPILQHSTLRLIASVKPKFAITKITWTAPGGISMKSEKKENTGTVAKLPQVQITDSGAYICMVYPEGNSSKALFAFNVDVAVDGPLISTATQVHTSFILTCPGVLGDYVLLYWQPPDSRKQNNMKLVHSYDRWRDSTFFTEKTERLKLASSPYNAEAGSFSFLLTPELKDGGLYICNVFLNDNAFSQRTMLTVLKVKTSLSSSELELGCLYSERSQVQSARWKYQNKSRQLKLLTSSPGTVSTILPFPITSDTAGNYTCTLQLKNGQTVWATQAVILPQEEKVSVTTPTLLPSLSALLLLVPLVAAAVGVLLWRQQHISDRDIEQSLSVQSGEVENIYEDPEDIRQDLKPRGEDDVYKELERAGFRHPRSGRMAGWMWLRCVLGPHLHRIHRSPDQSRPDGRAGRRVIACYVKAAHGLCLCLSVSLFAGMDLPAPESGETHRQHPRLGFSAVVSVLLQLPSSALLPVQERWVDFMFGGLSVVTSAAVSKLVPVSQYVGTVLVCLLGVACLRGWGRWKNSEYLQFITILEETKKNHTAANKKKVRCYDFDFSFWPSDFSWTEVRAQVERCSRQCPQFCAHSAMPHHQFGGAVIMFILFLSSFLIAHSFGRRMLYPGSVGLLQKAMRPMLQQGQARLIEEHDGQRNKLVACDGNEIDTMFVDRRRDGGPNGQTLVICCEGNAGFYEVGCMNTPLEGGYSVLGWNHPGFGGSTGVPFPQNEANAMDVVIQFAIHKLGFQLSDIMVYAWSIGGFTASWAVMSYPEIQSLVLDASFDDLLPLALKVMPDSWRPLVQHTVRQYMNLNNAEQLLKYQGPVLLIRRTRDEIITTTGPEDIMSNRGNNLLLKLLQFRYPKIMTDEGVRVVRQWLGSATHLEEASVYSGYEVDDDWCVSVLQSYQADKDVVFPWSVGEDMTLEGRRQLALFLARKYMRNFETTHCTPLPASEFHSPWRL